MLRIVIKTTVLRRMIAMCNSGLCDRPTSRFLNFVIFLEKSFVAKLFLKNEEHRQNEKDKTDGVVPAESFRFEKQDREDGENGQRDDFLDDFELPEIERTAVFRIADPVCRNLKAVFEQRDAPTD